MAVEQTAAAAPSAAVAAQNEEPAAPEMPQMNPQMMRQMMMLPMIWASGKVDWEDGSSLGILRGCFVVVLLLAIGITQVALSRVASKKDAGRVQKPGSSTMGFGEPAADGSVSVEAYDTAKVCVCLACSLSSGSCSSSN